MTRTPSPVIWVTPEFLDCAAGLTHKPGPDKCHHPGCDCRNNILPWYPYRRGHVVTIPNRGTYVLTGRYDLEHQMFEARWPD